MFRVLFIQQYCVNNCYCKIDVHCPLAPHQNLICIDSTSHAYVTGCVPSSINESCGASIHHYWSRVPLFYRNANLAKIMSSAGHRVTISPLAAVTLNVWQFLGFTITWACFSQWHLYCPRSWASYDFLSGRIDLQMRAPVMLWNIWCAQRACRILSSHTYNGGTLTGCYPAVHTCHEWFMPARSAQISNIPQHAWCKTLMASVDRLYLCGGNRPYHWQSCCVTSNAKRQFWLYGRRIEPFVANAQE